LVPCQKTAESRPVYVAAVGGEIKRQRLPSLSNATACCFSALSNVAGRCRCAREGLEAPAAAAEPEDDYYLNGLHAYKH
jgi:hypothetical protein